MDDMRKYYEDIFGILQVVDDIAFKTNMFALNAAIDAARADAQDGDYSLAAEEVRSLAVRSAQAAREMAELIEIFIVRAGVC